MKLVLWFLFFPQVLFAWTLSAPNLRGWQTRSLTVYWSSVNCSVSSDELKTIIDRAIDAWNRIPTTNLTIVRSAGETTMSVATFMAGTGTPMPIILCDNQFSTNQSADPDSIPALTHLTTYDPITYGGIIINSEAGGAANISNFSEDENVVILAHELGHLLGLGHSANQKALMYYSLNDKTSAQITSDDRDGITYLYPRNEFQGGVFGCAAVHRGVNFGPAGWSYLFMLTLLTFFSFVARRLFFAISSDRK